MGIYTEKQEAKIEELAEQYHAAEMEKSRRIENGRKWIERTAAKMFEISKEYNIEEPDALLEIIRKTYAISPDIMDKVRRPATSRFWKMIHGQCDE
jgi:vacuolar-type H+-ATPase subunit E/Vma4